MEEKQEAARQKSIKAELEWVRANPKARQAKSKARLSRFQELTSKEFQQAPGDQRDLYPARPAARRPRRSRSNGLRKGFGDRLLIDDLSLQDSARRDRRRHRSERRRQDDAVQDAIGTGGAGR